MPHESDWRTFRDMVPMLRERYLAERNRRIVEILTDSKRTETDRFWDGFEMMKTEGKTLEWCLDGHSRSKMWMFIISMIRAGMLKKEDMGRFSEDLQKEMAHEFVEKSG